MGGSLCWGIVEMSYNNLVVETVNFDPLSILKKGRERSRSGEGSGKSRHFSSSMNNLINRQRSASNSTSNKKKIPNNTRPNNTTRSRAASDPTPRSNRNTTLNFYKSYNLKKNGISQRNRNKQLIKGINSKKKKVRNNTYAAEFAKYKASKMQDKIAIKKATNNAKYAAAEYELTPNEVNAKKRYENYDKMFMTDPVRAFNDVLNALSEFNIILTRVGKGDISNEIQNLKNKYSEMNMLTTNNSYNTLCYDIIKLIEKIYPMLYNETTSITSALVGDEADLRLAFGKVYLNFTQKFICRDMINKSNTLKKLAQEF